MKKNNAKTPEVALKEFSKQAQTALSKTKQGISARATTRGGRYSLSIIIASVIVLVGLGVFVVGFSRGNDEPDPFITASPSVSPILAATDVGSPTHGAIASGIATVKEDEISVSGAPVQSVGSQFTENDLIIDGLPVIRAEAALVKKLGASEVIFESGDNREWPIASVTKIMTAVVAFEKLGADTIVTVSEHAVATEGVSGNLAPGEQYTVLGLVTAMMTMSSNDAAVALADAYDARFVSPAAKTESSSTEDEVEEPAEAKTSLSPFIQEMRAKAAALGMTETMYADASGLSVINTSTPRDIERLMVHVAQYYPEILQSSREREHQIIELTTRTPRTLGNINRFAGQFDFVGGKTGYTDEARGNLVSIFNYQGTQYIIIVFGTDDRFGETSHLYRWLKTKV